MNRSALTGLRAFYALVLGQFVSTIGSAITRFGVSVWVFTETGSTTAYTALVFFSIFPIGFGALIAGPFVDRWDRRKVMLISDAIAGVSTLVIAVLFLFDDLAVWQLYLALFINGVASAFARPALDGSVALLVPKAQLARASGLSQMIGAVETILSSAIAGFLVATFGLGAVFLIDVVTFGFNMLVLLLIRIPKVEPSHALLPIGSFWKDFGVGLQYVRQRPALLYLLGLFASTMFLLPGMAYSLVTPLVLSFSNETALGLILSGFGVGSLVGGIGLTLWNDSRRRMSGILIAMMIAGVATIIIGLREHTLLIGLGFVLIGISFVFIMGLNRVIWQMKVAPEMLGRVFALQLAVGVGAQSLGALLAGPLADNLFESLMNRTGAFASSIGLLIGTGPGRGIAVMFLLVGLIELVIVLVSALQPNIRLLEDGLPDAEAALLPIQPAVQPSSD
jgi:MFS family permease